MSSPKVLTPEEVAAMRDHPHYKTRVNALADSHEALRALVASTRRAALDEAIAAVRGYFDEIGNADHEDDIASTAVAGAMDRLRSMKVGHESCDVCECGHAFDWHAPVGLCVGKDCACRRFNRHNPTARTIYTCGMSYTDPEDGDVTCRLREGHAGPHAQWEIDKELCNRDFWGPDK